MQLQLKPPTSIEEIKEIMSPFLTGHGSKIQGSLNFNLLKISKENQTNFIAGDKAHLVWQYVRFNQSYREDFLSASKRERKLDPDSEAAYLEDVAFKYKWSISRMRHPDDNEIDATFCFSSQYIWQLKNDFPLPKAVQFKLSRKNTENREHKPAALHLVVYPGPHSQILEQMRRVLSKNAPEWNQKFSQVREHTRVHDNLVENLCAFLLVTYIGLKGRSLETNYGSIMRLNADERSDQIRKKFEAFQRLSSKSPEMFLIGFKNNKRS